MLNSISDICGWKKLNHNYIFTNESYIEKCTYTYYFGKTMINNVKVVDDQYHTNRMAPHQWAIYIEPWYHHIISKKNEEKIQNKHKNPLSSYFKDYMKSIGWEKYLMRPSWAFHICHFPISRASPSLKSSSTCIFFSL